MSDKIGILGSGAVGKALAKGFIKHGYSVKIGTGNTEKQEAIKKEIEKVETGTFSEAAKFGDIVVLAVKGSAATVVLKSAGSENIKSKIIIDTTNPIADAPPVNGVLKFFTDLNLSLMEMLQKEFSESKFVKAFSSVGSALMVDPEFPDGKPTMFIAGNDTSAKTKVTGILDEFGWETADMGPVEAARAIEPLCILWCIPGFSANQWTHAFKLLKL